MKACTNRDLDRKIHFWFVMSLSEYAHATAGRANYRERASDTASTSVSATGRPDARSRAGAVKPPV